MPRIRQLADKYAADDAENAKKAFQTAIGKLGEKTWYPSSRRLEPEFEETHQTISKYRNKPDKMPVSAMQRFVQIMKPDISVVLKFLGYSEKEIRAFVRENST